MQMQKYKKNVLRPNIWQFFSDMTDVDDVFSRYLFYMPLIVVQSSFAFFAISSIPERRTSEEAMTALW